MTLAGNNYRLNGFQIISLLAEKLTSDPTGVDGQQYFNTSLGAERIKSAGVWRSLIMDNDSRLTDGRVPTGPAGGVLTGSYPNPSGIANGSVGAATMTSQARGPGSVNGGNANISEPALRALGVAPGYAFPGDGRLDQVYAPLSNVSLNGYKATNLANPTSPQDAATKVYVDAAIQGLSVKNAVRVATVAGITLTGGAPASIDGVNLNTNDRVLVKNQANSTENGIYYVNGTNLTRTEDANLSSELQGAFVFVSEGSTYANTGWYQTSDNITLGTTALVWTQFSGAGQYQAGMGLSLNGTVFAVRLDGSIIDVNTSGEITVMPGKINTTQLTDLGVTNAKLADGAVGPTKYATSSINLNNSGTAGNPIIGQLPIAFGGTGANSATGARAAIGASGSYNFNNISNLTADTWYTVAHNLAANYPSVAIYDLASQEKIDGDVKRIDGNNIQIRLGASYSAGTLGIGIRG